MRASARRISSMVVGSVRMASPSYKKKRRFRRKKSHMAMTNQGEWSPLSDSPREPCYSDDKSGPRYAVSETVKEA